MRPLALLLLSAFCANAPCHVIWGDDGHGQTHHGALLPVRSDRESELLRLQASQLWERIAAELEQLGAMLESNNLEQLNPRLVGETHVEILRLQRLADELILRGETSGADLQRRAARQQRTIDDIVRAYLDLPGNQDRLALSYQTAQRESRERTRLLPHLEQLANRGQWKQAHEELCAISDFIHSRAVWYEPQQTDALLEPFAEVRQRIVAKHTSLHRQQGDDSLALLRFESSPHLKELIAGAQNLARADPADPTATAAARLQAFLKKWRRAQLLAVRCHGIDWARMGKSGRTQPPELAKLQQQWQMFIANAPSAIVGWLRLEIKQTEPAAARALYLELLPIFAEIVIDYDDEKFAASLADSLAILATRDERFQGEVAAYRAATSEILRWRARRAQTMAQTMAQRRPPAISAAHSTRGGEPYPLTLEEAVFAAALPGDGAPGLLAGSAKSLDNAQLFAPAPATAAGLAEKLVGQRVRVGSLTGSPGNRTLAMTKYGNRLIGMVDLPHDVETQWEKLRSDLLATGDLPPLTLEAAVALKRTRRGDFVESECEILQVSIESLTYRLSVFQPSELRSLSLGGLPTDRVRGAALDQVFVHVSLRPIWLQAHHDFLSLNHASQQELPR